MLDRPKNQGTFVILFLDKIYEKSKSMIANTTALVTFGINDVDTARQASERIGRTTVATQNHGFSQAYDAVLSRPSTFRIVINGSMHAKQT